MDTEKDSNGNILTSSVLVLNKLYRAVKVITARRAFIMLYKNTAEVISKYNGTFLSYDFIGWIENSNGTSDVNGDDFVSTPNFQIKIPQVIRLLSYDRFPKQELKFNRKNILARDGNRCQYCGKRYPVSRLSVDHIIPRSRSGEATWENMVACCSRCNTKKGGRLPKEAGMKLIKKPKPLTFHPIVNTRIKEKKYYLWKEFLSKKESLIT